MNNIGRSVSFKTMDVLLQLPKWPDYDDIKMYDKLIFDLFWDNENNKSSDIFLAFTQYKDKFDFPNKDILERYRLNRFAHIKDRKWVTVFNQLLCIKGVGVRCAGVMSKKVYDIYSWPDYDDIKMYDDLIFDLFYCKTKRIYWFSPEYKSYTSGHRSYAWPKEYIFKRYYNERYPNKTIRSWTDIIKCLCIERGLIEKSKCKHIDVLAIKPLPDYDDVKMYDDWILNTFYDKYNKTGKVTNAYKVMNNYQATREQCKDKSRWPEKFPNIDIINRYVKERYPGARNLLECIYRLTVERGLEEGIYCQHCGKLLWYINWHNTRLRKFCNGECMRNDEDYYKRWHAASTAAMQRPERRIKQGESLHKTIQSKTKEERSRQYGTYTRRKEKDYKPKEVHHGKFYGTVEFTSVNDVEKKDKNTHKQEEITYNDFLQEFPDALHNVPIDGYCDEYGNPYEPDIFIPSLNMIVECQYYPSHGDYPYDPEDKNLKAIEDEIIGHFKMRHVPEEKLLRVYEVTDPRKRLVAKECGYNYGEIWYFGKRLHFIKQIKDIIASGNLNLLRHVAIYKNKQFIILDT